VEVSVKNLVVGYDERNIIKDLSVDISKNEITTIIGPNGCGKSTLLKTITRILKNTDGVIALDGENINTLSTKDVAKKIAILAQQQKLPPDITVEELVAYGRIPHQKWYQQDSDEDREIIDWAIKLTKLDSMRTRIVNHLSGGERQRAWIATALAQKPNILFLDEPTTYLDVSHQLDVINLVKKLNKESGIGIVMVLHDINQAVQVSNKIIVMKCGKIYSQGNSEDVVTSKMLEDVYSVKASVLSLDECKCPVIIYHRVIEEGV